jgi:CAAX amino terminal protease family.
MGREKDIKFDLREAKIACIYLGVLFLLYLLPWVLLRGVPPLALLNIDHHAVPPVASINPAAALYWFGSLFPVFLLVMIRKQSLKTIGITTRNVGRSMVLLIIPFAYLLYTIFTSSFSPASLMVVAFAALIVGIVEEFLLRGFPLFRLEPLGRGIAILITGVVFAALHGLGAFPSILLFGLAWGLIFSKTRNILPLILLHMFVDFAGVL